MAEQAGAAFVIEGATVGDAPIAAGTVLIDDTSITLVLSQTHASDRAPRLLVEHVVSVGGSGPEAVLVMRDGTSVRLRAGIDEAALIRGRLLAACRALPELTRAMRSMGSRRSSRVDGTTGIDEARFFTPLLSALRAAASATTPAGALDAFDADRLRVAIDATLDSFAEARASARPPLMRALQAELGESVEPLHGAIALLGRASVDAAESPDDLERWRKWARTLRVVFETADRVWPAVQAVLVATPIPVVPQQPARKRGILDRFSRGGASVVVAATLLSARVVDAQHRTIRVPGVPVDSLLANGLDVVTVQDGVPVVVANPYDEELLRSRGWSFSEVTPRANRMRSGAAPAVFRSYDDPVRGIRFYLDSLAKVNQRVHVETVGLSYEQRPILAAKIGPTGDAPSRPNVIIMATYHAREWGATEVALRLIKYLATQTDARTDSLTRNRDVWIIPVANPDGYQYTHTNDRLWRKNRRPVGTSAAGATIYGVDLNRNHAYRWGLDNQGSSGNLTSETYRGPTPASEPETQAIQQFHLLHPPATSISFHTYGGLVLFPPGHAYGRLAGDLSVFRGLGGNDEHPAVRDRLIGSLRTAYHTGPGWNLYTTNGEYTDWAYATVGTIAFTPEVSTGYEDGDYYGFEFPDNEGLVETLFRDNLPFALEVIEAAADPSRYRSANTGVPIEPIVLESVSPLIRLRVPVASGVTVSTTQALVMRADTLVPPKYFRRILSDTLFRPARVTVNTVAAKTDFTTLAIGGAEATDTAWRATGMARTTGAGLSSSFAWFGQTGNVRSPIVSVPAANDTVSLLYWTRFDGNGSAPTPHGEIRVSFDRGVTWTRVGSVSGEAPTYYPERVVVGNVAGKNVQFEFAPLEGLRWWIDEAAIVGHATNPKPIVAVNALRPSANPVRDDFVFFNWPFIGTAGEMRAYDFAGRLVWKTGVTATALSVRWDVAASRIPNGVFVVVAEAGKERHTFKLFVTRKGPEGLTPPASRTKTPPRSQ